MESNYATSFPYEIDGFHTQSNYDVSSKLPSAMDALQSSSFLTSCTASIDVFLISFYARHQKCRRGQNAQRLRPEAFQRTQLATLMRI